MKEWAMSMINQYFASVPDVKATDIIEIIIIAAIMYEIALWIKNTKAWMLLHEIQTNLRGIGQVIRRQRKILNRILE